jgi:ABC-type arginine/histidine transport system permease subunit
MLYVVALGVAFTKVSENVQTELEKYFAVKIFASTVLLYQMLF